MPEKKKIGYETAELKVTLFEQTDVVATSAGEVGKNVDSSGNSWVIFSEGGW